MVTTALGGGFTGALLTGLLEVLPGVLTKVLLEVLPGVLLGVLLVVLPGVLPVALGAIFPATLGVVLAVDLPTALEVFVFFSPAIVTISYFSSINKGLRPSVPLSLGNGRASTSAASLRSSVNIAYNAVSLRFCQYLFETIFKIITNETKNL
jgi:hypothetical protein